MTYRKALSIYVGKSVFVHNKITSGPLSAHRHSQSVVDRFSVWCWAMLKLAKYHNET